MTPTDYAALGMLAVEAADLIREVGGNEYVPHLQQMAQCVRGVLGELKSDMQKADDELQKELFAAAVILQKAHRKIEFALTKTLV